MQPLHNLKSFLALLLVLAIPGALLVAYFRNYSPEAGSMGHGHDMGGKASGKNRVMPTKSHEGMGSSGKNGMSPSLGDDKMKGMPAMPPMEESGPPAILHIGAKGFFLDRPQTFTPRADQAKMFSDIKERTAMEMIAADKKIQDAEQQLWKLTASDRPSLAEIETKAREVEKLRGDQRIAFIRSVSEAAHLLTAEQKEALLRDYARAAPGATVPAMPGAKQEEKTGTAHKH